MSLGYSYKTLQLPFEIELTRAESQVDPGTNSVSTYSGFVKVFDQDLHMNGTDCLITMNEPLNHRGFKVYQSNFTPAGTDPVSKKPIARSGFTVGRDPRLLAEILRHCHARYWHCDHVLHESLLHHRQSTTKSCQPSHPQLPDKAYEQRQLGTATRTRSRALIALNLLAMGYMGFKSIEPYFVASSYEAKQAAPQLSLPNLDLKTWSERPVLEEGRVKPMQTVAIETVRLITGRAKFQEQKAMPLFLSWIFYDPQAKDSKGIDWDNYEFILCEDHDLRAEIFNVKPNDPDYEKKVHSKYISPWQLYRSDAFQRLIVAVDKKRKEDGERFDQNLDTLERKAHAVEGRLNAYQELTGRLRHVIRATCQPR